MSEENTQTHENAQASTQSSEVITIKKDNLWKYSTFALLAVLVIVGIVAFTGGSTTGNAVAPTAVPTPSQGGAQPTVALSFELSESDHIKGDPNAPVTIVEYSDFECPFCARFYSQTLPSIESEYIDTGKAKLIYRDFPLGFHAQAQKAAEAAECAGEQGMYWEMHDLLFEQGVTGGVSTFKGYAGQLGLNQADFDSCLDSGKFASQVQDDMREGQGDGIRGTPGFLIVDEEGNAVPLSGAQPFTAFQQVIEAQLA